MHQSEIIKLEKARKPLSLEDIQKAKDGALEDIELEVIKDKQDAITRDFLSGKISAKDFDTIIDNLDEQLGALKFNSESDFRKALELCGYPKDQIEREVTHEVEHFKKAIQLGVEAYFQIQFVKVYNWGKLYFDAYPSINVKFPDDMPDEEQRRLLKEIINASHDMSPRDMAQLG